MTTLIRRRRNARLREDRFSEEVDVGKLVKEAKVVQKPKAKPVKKAKPKPKTLEFLKRQKETLEEALVILEQETIDDIFSIGAMLRETTKMIKEISDCEE